MHQVVIELSYVVDYVLVPVDAGFLVRLFVSGCRVFTLHGFVVICDVFGS